MNAHDFIYDDSEEMVSAKPRTSSGKASFKPGEDNRGRFGRRGKSPKQFNGIHRRRTKKIKW